MRAVLTLAALLALSGCTTIHDPGQWSKPSASVPQITFDDMECERQSREIPGTPDLIVGGVVDIPRIAIEHGQREHIYTRCMQERGYQNKAQQARAG